MRVLDVIKAKATPLPAIQQTESILNAVRQMLAIKESGLLILTPSATPIGIITEKDVMRLIAERYTQLEKVEVWEVMSKELTSVLAEADVESALDIMTEKHIHHLPVEENGKTVGLISLDDIISARLKKTEAEARQLKDFIAQQ